MFIVLITLLYLASVNGASVNGASVDAQRESLLWGNNFWINHEGDGYLPCYDKCVFKFTTFPSSSLAARYCDQIAAEHNYSYPSEQYQLGYCYTGYKREGKPEGVYFRDFKNTFKRYCYLPADGLGPFYVQYPTLKKVLYYIPALYYLVPYWVKGDIVHNTAVDTLITKLPARDGDLLSQYPDIPLNILYSDNDPLVTYTDACVIYAQLAKSSATIEMDEGEPVEIRPFPNIKILKVTENNGNYVTEVQNFDPALMPDVIKSYEKRRWWLKNLWASRLILTLAVLSILVLLTYNHKPYWKLAFPSSFYLIYFSIWRL